MSDCCATKKPVSTKEFLVEKAKNLRTWLLSYQPDDDVKKYVEMFDEKLLLPTIQVALVPLVKKGGIPSAAKDLAKKIKVPAGEEEAFLKKFEAYANMFVEVFLAMDEKKSQ